MTVVILVLLRRLKRLKRLKELLEGSEEQGQKDSRLAREGPDLICYEITNVRHSD